MLKYILIFTILISSLYAKDKIEIYATTMQTEKNIVKADGEVTVVYKDYFLTAKRAVYDKDSGDLELFDNIRATQGKNYKLLGNYAKLNIAKKERMFKPFYMLETTSDVWISADEGCAKDINIDIESGVLSGCDPSDPLWQMEFSSSDYNTDTMWLNIYNARIYIYDILVFYTPYFGYSLDTTRRTGLLPPAIGMSDIEGFYYEQPIYIAEQTWWDLELKPQVRTERGYGAYSTFRFIDSKVSSGELTMGYFKEKQKYVDTYKLANEKHYGYNFKYDNLDVINQWFGSSFDGQSGLYLDINGMNDVDYINLSTNDASLNVTSTQVLSRGNFFYNTSDNYFGVYGKYYKDLTKEHNNDTIQKLPTLHYHHYIDTFLDNHLFYNVDMQSNNIYRKVGGKVIQTDLNIPIKLRTTMFDEYLNISYEASLYGQYSSFSGDTKSLNIENQDSYFARNYHMFSASSQVTRAYEDLTHVVDFGAKYILGGSEQKNGFYEAYEGYCADPTNKLDPQFKDRCEFYNIKNIDEELKLDFTQYLYSSSGEQILYQRLTQNISYEKKQDGVGELEHELDIQFNSWINFYNNMFYNYDEESFSKIYNVISLKKDALRVSLSHLYKDTFLDKTLQYSPYTSYLTSSASYQYDKHYSYSISYNYDLETKQRKSFEIGFMYKKRCWDFGLRYLENNRPILVKQGVISQSESVYDRYLYFTINLKPFMDTNSGPLYGWKFTDSAQGM